jgi:hypothetical protein
MEMKRSRKKIIFNLYTLFILKNFSALQSLAKLESRLGRNFFDGMRWWFEGSETLVRDYLKTMAKNSKYLGKLLENVQAYVEGLESDDEKRQLF